MALAALALLLTLSLGVGERAGAEQASAPSSPAAAQLDAGADHSCAVVAQASVRCWGFGGDGRLGYANLETIGDFETPGSVGPVDLGADQPAAAISAGGFHSCALLRDASVRCWGFAAVGALGYGNTRNIGDDEPPGSAGPVNLGAGRTARAISAGESHTCAILNLGAVRCWGLGRTGRLGYADPLVPDIGDDETPGSVGPVDLGPGRSATAITAGSEHTCALLDDLAVRCWGGNFDGELGYPNRPDNTVGDNETPATVGPVNLGGGARAITAGAKHTCAILDDATVRCWGSGRLGQLGYANTQNIGDDETPASAGAVNLGIGRTAKAISAGAFHTCALLEDGTVRCWGWNGDGRLGYGQLEFGGLNMVGDNEPPASVGPVDLGPGRTATAISAGGRHTCARLDDDSVRCWGYGAVGSLGYCNQRDIGDDETPGSAGPVNLSTAACAATPPAPTPVPAAPTPGPPTPLPAAPAPVAASPAGLSTAKLSLARARIVRRDRVLDVLAPITGLASGSARVQLHAAGLLHSFDASINQRDGRIRFRKLIPRAQARLGTGILTISYRGDADTRPQTVRLRAASQPADLRLTRPTISNGRLRAAGTVSRRARGVVRVQIDYVVAGRSYSREFKARIAGGRWSLNQRLSQTVRTAIRQRTGTVHSYTLFTGYFQRRVRGEMRSYQVLGRR